jgi:Fur family peroxide stress response transcriptional regulator
MSVCQEELQRRLERFRDVCRRSGMKLTHQRMEIFREVARTADHPDAQTVYERVRKRVPAVSLDTVYRNLWLLSDLGLLSTLGPPRERARFDANMTTHHHFVCSRCGMAQDFYSREFDELRPPEAVRSVGEVERIQVELRGLCARCGRKAKKEREVDPELGWVHSADS